ncbi:tape measure protein [Paenibacillus assamensis]|uniref:tape measure protein n=1 Tax=Paenibacillus assamensis TaxID=311244 RepID=UPI00040D2C9B|nr:tape measure protein [Paenibacillus assamensis]
MSTIATTLAMRDNFSNTLNRAAQGTQRVIRSMQTLQAQSARTSPGRMFTGTSSSISRASQRMEVLNRKQQELANHAKKVKNEWSGVGGVIAGVGSKMQAVDAYANNNTRLSTVNEGNQRPELPNAFDAAERSRGNYSQTFTATSSAISGTSQRLDMLNRKQVVAAKNAEQVKTAWGGIKTVMAQAIASLAAGTGAAMQAVDTHTKNNARLKSINDGKQSDVDLQKMVHGSAQRSGAGYTDMVGTVSKLGLTAGDSFNSNKEMVAFSELMQKSFASSGASAAEQQSGVNQLTQAMASGKLQEDGFGSIMENAPVLAQAIADFTGKSIGELKKMSAEGALTADIIKGSLFAASDNIEAKFKAMPRTFASTWTQIQNFATMAFAGVMESINAFLNSDIGAGLVTGIMVAIAIIASGVEGLISIISTVASFVQSNWSIIGPILTVLATTAIMYLISLIWAWGVTAISMLWAWGSAAVVNGLRAFAAFMLANWPILLIGAAIGVLIVILNNMGVTFDQVLGFIGGALFGLYAFIYNIVVGIWNYWASFVEFFANVFNHPVYSVKRLFVNLANSVLDTVKRIAEAIDAVFGSNLSGSVTGLQKQMDDWLGEMPEGYKVTQRLETKSITEFSTKGYQAGSDMAKGMQDKIKGITSGFSGDAMKENGLDKSKGKGLGGGGAAGITGAAGAGKMPNIGKVGEVGQVNSEVDIGEEDLQMMKDVAEMRYVQNFVTMTPTIAMNASISEKVDVNDVMNEMERRLANEIAMSAEGTYS